MDVHLNGFYKTVMVIAGIFTLGLGALLMWFSLRKFPKHIDASGITRRDGKKFMWSELTDTRAVTVVGRYGVRITGRLELIFGKQKVQIVPQSFKEGQGVIKYINEILGTQLQTG